MRLVVERLKAVKWDKGMGQDLALNVMKYRGDNLQLSYADIIKHESRILEQTVIRKYQIQVKHVPKNAVLCVEGSSQFVYYRKHGRQVIISKSKVTTLYKVYPIKELLRTIIKDGHTVHVAESLDKAMDWFIEPNINRIYEKSNIY